MSDEQSPKLEVIPDHDSPKPMGPRTKAYALEAVRFFCSLPTKPIIQILGKQFVRSATSVGAHYREASRARSTAEFISKMEVGSQELDESLYWLELMVDSGLSVDDRIQSMLREGNELLAMFVASVRTAKQRVDR